MISRCKSWLIGKHTPRGAYWFHAAAAVNTGRRPPRQWREAVLRVGSTARSWREGKSISSEVVKQAKAIGFKHDKTQQALLQESLNLLFAKYGEDQIA